MCIRDSSSVTTKREELTKECDELNIKIANHNKILSEKDDVESQLKSLQSTLENLKAEKQLEGDDLIKIRTEFEEKSKLTTTLRTELEEVSEKVIQKIEEIKSKDCELVEITESYENSRKLLSEEKLELSRIQSDKQDITEDV